MLRQVWLCWCSTERQGLAEDSARLTTHLAAGTVADDDEFPPEAVAGALWEGARRRQQHV
jgi:hypothetical protein